MANASQDQEPVTSPEEPPDCAMSKLFMWASLGDFIVAVIIVFFGGCLFTKTEVPVTRADIFR